MFNAPYQGATAIKQSRLEPWPSGKGSQLEQNERQVGKRVGFHRVRAGGW